jgi:hypothetical protein
VLGDGVKPAALSKLNRHYQRSILKENNRDKLLLRKKSTISHTSSFVTDEGAAIKLRSEVKRLPKSIKNQTEDTDKRKSGEVEKPLVEEIEEEQLMDLFESPKRLKEDPEKRNTEKKVAKTMFFQSTLSSEPPPTTTNRLKQIAEFVEGDDLNGFKLWGVTKQEMVTLRFGFNMNLL